MTTIDETLVFTLTHRDLTGSASPVGVLRLRTARWPQGHAEPWETSACGPRGRLTLRAYYTTSPAMQACDTVEWGIIPDYDFVTHAEAFQMTAYLKTFNRKLETLRTKWGDPATVGDLVLRVMDASGIRDVARQAVSGSWEVTSHRQTVRGWVNEPIIAFAYRAQAA